jgi:hypothetical protein
MTRMLAPNERKKRGQKWRLAELRGVLSDGSKSYGKLLEQREK